MPVNSLPINQLLKNRVLTLLVSRFRLAHLILVDPWGINVRRPGPHRRRVRLPWYLVPLYYAFRSSNPLAIFRLLGPAGKGIVTRPGGRYSRPDLVAKFSGLFPSYEDAFRTVTAYFYHCNAAPPT